jgi:S1-C subfamily serine protease
MSLGVKDRNAGLCDLAIGALPFSKEHQTPTKVIIEVPKGSAADRAGLKSGDLLLKINESKVSKFGQIRRLNEESDTRPLRLQIVRDQTPITLTLQP